ncbi:MAG: SDR family NAD(P)-dependent oxidoreductase [Flavobacteriales bacterium]|nr:SDR family NAD(P)-dependent oxidoreductase [Flavobacteriales bacterium]
MKTVLITGANSGIGKDTARQIALLSETEKVYLGCRNPQRAEAAKKELEATTGRNIFEIVKIDVSDLESVRTAVASLSEPIEGLVMNAGGMGGKNPEVKTRDGVVQIIATNVLGHVVLLEELLRTKKLIKVAVYAGSEAVRGVPMMGMARPNMRSYSVDEFAAVADGSFFKKFDPMEVYGYVKLMAAMWMSSVARKNPEVRIVTMSPGGTSGTSVMEDLPPVMKFFFKNVGMKIMPLLGLFHSVEVGAKRFVDALNDSQYKSGKFYASKSGVSGKITDQATIFSEIDNAQYQDNASEALHRFLK